MGWRAAAHNLEAMPAIEPDVALGHLGGLERQALQPGRSRDPLEPFQHEASEAGALPRRIDAQPVDVDAAIAPFRSSHAHNFIAVDREIDVAALDGGRQERVVVGGDLATEVANVRRECRPQDALGLVPFRWDGLS